MAPHVAVCGAVIECMRSCSTLASCGGVSRLGYPSQQLGMHYSTWNDEMVLVGLITDNRKVSKDIAISAVQLSVTIDI